MQATAEKTEDLSRPSVVVKMPEVRLTMQDLGYLRSLANPEGLRCHPGNGTVERLRFLDLIARAKVYPPKDVLATNAKTAALKKASIKTAVSKEDWGAARSLCYDLESLTRDAQAKEQDVLTEKGKQLLRQGDVTVKVRKVGCVGK